MVVSKWFLLILLLPVLELYVLIQVGAVIGAGVTIALVLLTALLGVALLRVQGLSTLGRGLRRMELGEVPAAEMVEGMLLVVAGGTLVTPGFLTDVVGFLLLVSPLRVRLSHWLLGRLDVSVGPGVRTGHRAGPQGPHVRSGHPRGRIIDGEYERRDEENDDTPR